MSTDSGRQLRDKGATQWGYCHDIVLCAQWSKWLRHVSGHQVDANQSRSGVGATIQVNLILLLICLTRQSGRSCVSDATGVELGNQLVLAPPAVLDSSGAHRLTAGRGSHRIGSFAPQE